MSGLEGIERILKVDLHPGDVSGCAGSKNM